MHGKDCSIQSLCISSIHGGQDINIAVGGAKELTKPDPKNTDEPVPIELTKFFIEDDLLIFILNRNVLPGWIQEFQNPRQGHGSILGYEPEFFDFIDNRSTIILSGNRNEKFIQEIVNHFKTYIEIANINYKEQLKIEIEET